MDKDWRDVVQHGDIERLRELLDSGADINAGDRHGQTALTIAARNGQVDVVRWLVVGQFD